MNTSVVDLTTVTKQEFKELMRCKGVLVRTGKYSFRFVERGANEREFKPWLHWFSIAKSLFGKVSLNARHTKVELYIPHDEKRTPAQLADLIERQVEQLCDVICESDIQKMVKSIQELQPEEDEE